MKYLKILESEESSKCTITKPPGELPHSEIPSIFLAGSIEMGKAEDWQTKVQNMLKYVSINIFNPRRDDWDSSWEQTIENKQFREQVEWELNALDVANYIIVYFDPKTQSPITLLELGRHIDSGKLLVCCPEGYFRKGNVDIICAKHNVPMFNDIDSMVSALLVKISGIL